MGKSNNNGTSPSGTSKLGKGKLTPIQIAYLVERYLSDNNYSKTLSSFRSETSHLFPKTNSRVVPKGLLTLDAILDEYITLKQKKVTVDLEKRKMETFIQGIQDSLRVYQSSDASPSASTPLPHASHHPSRPQHQPICTVNPLPISNLPATSSALTLPSMTRLPLVPANPIIPGATTPQHHMIQSTSIINSSGSLIPNKARGSRSKKRYQKLTPVAPAPKRSCTEHSDTSTIGGIRLPSQINATCQTDVLTNAKSSVQKSLFKQTPESHVNQSSSSPKTPLQPSPSSPSDISVSPGESPPHQSPCTTTDNNNNNNNDNIPQQMTPSRCSVVSSKKVIVISPFKKAGYYSVERSHHVSTSPLKSSSNQSGKREHVKSRLDFDSSEEPPSTSNHVKNETTVEEEEDYIFDVDFLESIGDITFSQVLDFLDSGVDDMPSFPISNTLEDFTNRSSCENGFLLTNQVSSNLQTVAGAVSSEQTNVLGPESIESIRTVTKCIQIVSPVKSSNASSLEKTT